MHDAPIRECLVRFGEPQRASSFGTYHQWFTEATINAWTNRLVMSNEGLEGTFVYGNFRAIYNFSSRYAGSPYHQSWTSPTSDCHYSMAMPRDELVLGTDNFNKIHGPGNNAFSDGFLAREQTGHWIARQLGRRQRARVFGARRVVVRGLQLDTRTGQCRHAPRKDARCIET